VKAIVWQGPSEMTVEERPDPGEPGAGELILQPEAVGICGSEIEGYLGHMGNRTPPLVMGHEFAGRVVAAGPGADELAGARVAVNPLSGCGHCALCQAGFGNICPDRVLIGVHVPGAFADYVKVPAKDARVLPEGVSARLGALMEPLANGVHAVRLAGEGIERTVVLGAGTIGLVTLHAALLSGIPHVAVVEPHDARRERAATLGAHAVYGSPDEAREEPDLVLDAVGAQATRALGLELLRPGGTMVCIGLAQDDTTLGFHGIVRSQHRIQGSYAYTMADYDQAHEWLVSGAASLGDDLTEVRPLDEGPEQFARLAAGTPAEFKVFLAGAGREA
jgi:(R,R)-butanediol dehydrogenase / meso-butanediol dehydrogenase / diacetyl reductase